MIRIVPLCLLLCFFALVACRQDLHLHPPYAATLEPEQALAIPEAETAEAQLAIEAATASDRPNILPYMRDGMESETIRAILREDIQDAIELTAFGLIDIWYYEYDLNGDGHSDFIIYTVSPLHCGSGGCSLGVYISDGAGGHFVAGALTVRLLSPEQAVFRPEVSVSISENKTSGFHDIVFAWPDHPGGVMWYNKVAERYVHSLLGELIA